MNKYFLHLGLHKTGTKFFQHKVFPNLPQDFIYNPPKLTQLICDLMKADDCDLEIVADAIAKEKLALEKDSSKKVVISREIMSGNLFAAYKHSDQTISRLHQCFPEAHILCAFRFQADWLVSCYRESVHEHHYQSIEKFIGIERQDNNKFVSFDYKNLDYNRIIEKLLSSFGENNVSFFFYEDLKANKPKSVKDFASSLGLDDIPITNDNDVIPNRGYSRFSILLSITRYKLLTALGLSNYMVHRPIFFFGEGSIPAGYKELSVLPIEKYWEGFLHDNEEVRSKNYPNLTFSEKIKKEFTWRNFIKNRLDKLFYWDSDLLGNNRLEVESFFKKKNKNTFTRHKSNFPPIPKKYL